jgi:Ser/Thr protein kinase RdoA (MazF antagonist)
MLPALPTALNAAAMEEILASRLEEHVVVHACAPCYIRYKPATNCIVQYRLTLEDKRNGEIHETTAHVKLYAAGRAARVWSSGSLHELSATATDACDSEPPFARAAHLPELDAVLQVYPVDAALPGLALAASAAGRRRVLVQELRRPDAGDDSIQLVRYKPARKALLRYDAADGAVYAKLYARERGGLVFRVGNALLAAGVPTARPLLYLPGLHLLAHEESPGTPLRTLDGTPAFDQGVRAAGETLARLHALAPVGGLHRHTWADEAAAIVASARSIGVLLPHLAAEATAVAERAAATLAELPEASMSVHGDFYDDQVLLHDDAAVLIDLDGIRCGHPLLDVSNFLAHLSVRDANSPARAAFLEAYGPTQPDIVSLLEATALLKLALAPFRRLEPDWPDAVERRVRLAARRLGDPAPKHHRRLDPAMPQLAVLRNPSLVRHVLEDVYGEHVDVEAATVVRHKPGRRCTLRYDILAGSGGRAERLYAKTFASERGPRVHKSVKAIAEARACGPATVLPEPVAYISRLNLLLQREVAGIPVRAALLTGDRRLAVKIAEALAALHASDVELDRQHGLEDELAILRGRVKRIGRSRLRAHRCLARIEAAATAVTGWRSRPVHRDFYYDQLVIDSEVLGVLDFDDASMSEPAVDVANFLAHLRLLALDEPARVEAVDAVALAFRACLHELDPALDPLLVRLLESATLLRLACIHELHVERLLDEAEALLPNAEPAPRVGARRPTRLELALDEAAVLSFVADAVEEWMGTRPSNCRPILLRHKKRRTVVRYDLMTGQGTVAIVGKWFPNDRGGAVVDVLSALREHGFAGSAFAVPAPILHVPELQVVFTEAVAGPSLRKVLDANVAAAARAGAWLARFHTCGVVLPCSRPPATLATTVLGWSKKTAILAPLAAQLATALRTTPDPNRPVHFDYASADVLVPEDGPTVVVDFDDTARGDPALDVANFEATLTLRGWRKAGAVDAFAAARSAFRAGYVAHAPLPSLSPAVEAVVWLRLAHRGLRRNIHADVWRFALDRAAESLTRDGR